MKGGLSSKQPTWGKHTTLKGSVGDFMGFAHGSSTADSAQVRYMCSFKNNTVVIKNVFFGWLKELIFLSYIALNVHFYQHIIILTESTFRPCPGLIATDALTSSSSLNPT